MHAPETEAFRIYGPRGVLQELRKRRKIKQGLSVSHPEDYRYSPVLRICHVDPETDGSDDSCGYTSPRIPKADLERIRKEAEFEYGFFFGKEFGQLQAASCYEVVHAVWAIIRWRFYRKRVTPKDLIEISDLASNPTDNLRRLVYSSKHDPAEFERLWICVFRCQARIHRPWYRKPKWHVHHWRFKFDLWADFRRKFRKKLARANG